MVRLSGVRLTDVLGAMSLAVDLGLGQPMGHVARSCLLADRLGDRMGLPAEDRQQLYYVTLMGWVGCIADSHAAAAGHRDHRPGHRGGLTVELTARTFSEPDEVRRFGRTTSATCSPATSRSGWRTVPRRPPARGTWSTCRPGTMAGWSGRSRA